MKVLNLYAGIGGNRRLWENVEVTAIEINKDIARVYQKNFPCDKVIIGDAHEYLLNNYNKFDFIWSSPPCPTHSDIRRMGVNIGQNKPLYPDMTLYQEIILLKHFFKGRWVVENVISYYNPLIPAQKRGRHYYWANFFINDVIVESDKIVNGNIKEWEKITGFNLSDEKGIDKRKVYRNCVNPKLALHIFNSAFKDKQKTLSI